MTFVCKHVGIFVHDLRAAEEFYRRVFGMELLFRETRADGDRWHTLRPDLGWSDADALGIEIDMVALHRDEFVLAVFRGTPQVGTVAEICVGMSRAELDEVRARLGGEAGANEGRAAIQFEDPFGFRWNVQERDVRFRSSGEIAGHWLELLR